MARQNNQAFGGTCGFFSIISMIFFGSIFGGIGLTVAHYLTKHLSDYYLILIPAIVLGILFGLGLNFGAKIGRCSKFSVLTFLFVLLFSLIVYAKLLFFNNYHDSYAQNATLGEEALFLTVDSWNMLDAIPVVTDYIEPLTDQQARDAVANIPVLSSLFAPADTPDASNMTEQPAADTASQAEQPTPVEGAETQPPAPSENAASPVDTSAPAQPQSPRDHIGRQLLNFVINFPQYALAEEPVIIGTVFHLSLLEPVRQYLEYPGVTEWDEATNGRLLFNERAVKPWMGWAVEWVFVWLIAVLMTRSGTKKAYANYQKRLEKKGGGKPQGLQMKTSAPEKTEEKPQETGKKKTSGFSLFGKKKAKKAEEATEREKQSPVEDAEAKKPKKKKKSGFFGFGKKKTEEIEQNEDAGEQSGAAGGEELTFSEEETSQQEQLYAIILHQFNPQRQDDLVRLLQQVGQVPEESARKLLKTPSLVKRDVNVQQANIAIQKFQQVQAQVKLMTMEQLAQLQNKQRQTTQPTPTPPPIPAEKATKAPAPQPQKAAPASGGQPGEKYALILRKFDQSQRKQVVELLASLSGTPVAQLQQSLKTPALVLRDASRDEVMMISQQFQKIQAETKMLTMAELQKLTNKSG